MSGSATKAATGIGGALAALVLVIIVPIAAALTALNGGGSGSAPSRRALDDIPSRMLALYRQAAGTCPGLPWSILAAIGKVETDHGRATNQVSSAGAVGPMQFLPSTFTTYARPVPPGGRTPPTPWDPVDAVHAAGRLLCANGARGGHDLDAAVFAYNHSETYVKNVLAIAARYADPASAGGPAPSPAAATALAFARAHLGTPYVWGGNGPEHGDAGFDCSGLTQAAYAAAGVHLPRVAQNQYDDGPAVPHGAPPLPGDLVFFGTRGHLHHVGLYLGHGRMIHAPHTGTTVRISPLTEMSDYYGAARPWSRRR